MLIPVLLLMAQMGTQEITVRRARNWNQNATEGYCAIKVWVDGEADFAVRGERLRIITNSGQPARDVASECSAPLPRNPSNFRFRGIDGRGDVQLIEEPNSRNGFSGVVRIRDTKSGGEEYHFRLEWTGGSPYTGNYPGRGDGGFFGNNNSGSNYGGDVTNMRTRELRREIENLSSNVRGRRPSMDEVDNYIDRVRFDRWTMNDIRADLERRR